MLLCKKLRHVLFSTSLIISFLNGDCPVLLPKYGCYDMFVAIHRLDDGCLAEMIMCLGLLDDRVIYPLVA